MKPLIEQIQEILTPNNSVGLVKNERIYQLQPVMPFSQLMDMAETMDEAGQKDLLAFLNEEGTVIFNGIIYLATRGLNFQGRLKEILTVYNDHLKQVVGDKKALIDLYDRIPVEDIANLTEDHVIFVMKPLLRQPKKALAAIRYLPEYEVHFEKYNYQFPGCTIALHIDTNLTIDNPEVVPEGKLYEHPFVFRDQYRFGQKICMGSFYNSDDKTQFNALRFANNVNNLIKQSIQILISGYNRHVTPAAGHLGTAEYAKYLKK